MITSISDQDLTWMLEQQHPSRAVEIAKQFLSDDKKRPLSANPSYEDLNDLLATLHARQKHTKRDGIVAYGLDALISSLERRSKTQKIIGIAYRSDDFFGKFYFDEQEGRLIGFTVIDQRQKAKFEPPSWLTQ